MLKNSHSYYSKNKSSVANYYIWNLALADQLYVLALPLFCWATLRSVRK